MTTRGSQVPKQILTQDRLKEVLHYNPDTGIFTWIEKVSNKINVGDIAGSNHSSGYFSIMIDCKNYMSHRLAFLYMDGSFPTHDVDHRYGEKKDNRWEKIRRFTRQQNSRNQKLRNDNKSGATGVFWYARKSKWVASIRVDGASKHLGYFIDFDDAVYARKQADIKYGFDVSHGRS